MNARRETPRALWWLQHGATLWILFMMIAAGALALAADTLLGAIGCRCGWWSGANVFESPDGLVFHDSNTCEGCWEYLPGHTDPVGTIDHVPIRDTYGLLFDTVRVRGESFHVNMPDDVPADEAFTQQAIAASALDTNLAWLASFKPGRTTTRTIIWPGVALNTVSILIVSAFVYGFVTRGRRAARIERFKHGRCPVCQYAIEGLPTAICPECGTDITRTARADGASP